MSSEHAFMECALGVLELVAEGDALTEINFRQDAPGQRTRRDARCAPVLREGMRQIEDYLAGRRHEFNLPLEPRGTPFQRRVWDAVCAIPYGRTASYGEIARRIGRPGASRAVGAANGRNPLPIVIPCHRVIGHGGRLTGYGGGLPIKQHLLSLEGAILV